MLELLSHSIKKKTEAKFCCAKHIVLLSHFLYVSSKQNGKQVKPYQKKENCD